MLTQNLVLLIQLNQMVAALTKMQTPATANQIASDNDLSPLIQKTAAQVGTGISSLSAAILNPPKISATPAVSKT